MPLSAAILTVAGLTGKDEPEIRLNSPPEAAPTLGFLKLAIFSDRFVLCNLHVARRYLADS